MADARNKAKELLARLSLGDDPFVEKNQRRTVPTYRDFILKRYLPYMKTHKRSWRVDEAQLRLHILPVLGGLYMDEIRKQHAIELLRQHREEKRLKPSSTNRMLNVAHRTFSCALEWEIQGVASSSTPPRCSHTSISFMHGIESARMQVLRMFGCMTYATATRAFW